MTDSSATAATAVWTAPQCPFKIEYSLRALDDIRLAVIDAFFSLPRGGAEIGGILLGSWSKGRLAITDYVAVDCEHAFGPSFALSRNDEARFSQVLAAGYPGRQIVGWYHSHTRSEIFLSQADLEIHRRFFPEPWQVALVLRPHTFEPTRIGFFFRDGDGNIHSEASYHEDSLTALPLKPAVGGMTSDAAAESTVMPSEPQPPVSRSYVARDNPLLDAAAKSAALRQTDQDTPAASPVNERPKAPAPHEVKPVQSSIIEATAIESTPIETAPIEAVAAKIAPAETANVEPAPVKTAPIEAATVKPAPVKTAPIEAATVKPVPDKAAPIEAATVKPAPVKPAPLETATVKPAPVRTAPVDTAPIESEAPTFGMSFEAERRASIWPWAFALAMVIALTWAGYFTREAWWPKAQTLARRDSTPLPPAIGLNVLDSDGQLQIHWNSQSTAVARAVGSGVLRITGAGPFPNEISLDKAHLQNGYFTFQRQSERVDVALIIPQPSGPPAVEITSFLGKMPDKKTASVEDPDAKQEREKLASQVTDLQNQLKTEVQENRTLKRAMDLLQNQLRLQTQKRLANQDKQQ